jgi:hypothetical protein
MRRKAKAKGTFRTLSRTYRQGWIGVPRENGEQASFFGGSRVFREPWIARNRAQENKW